MERKITNNQIRTKNCFLTLVSMIFLIGCNPESIVNKPVASFDYSPKENIKITDTIKFSNSSEFSNYYYWDFGDGSTSTEKEPTHLYNIYGSYKVTLITTNDGLMDTISNNINISYSVSFNETWDFDVDGDKINDFRLIAGGYGLISPYRYSSITPISNYAIITDSVIADRCDYGHDPRCYKVLRFIPKIYELGNSIKSSEKLTLQTLLFAKSEISYTNSENLDIWISPENRYVGICKIIGDKTKIGWIKLKVSDFSSITFISYKIPTDCESLIIDK